MAFVRFLRLIADDVLEPVEAVKAYHAVLEKLGISARRSLEDDLELQTGVMSYGGSGGVISLPGRNEASTGGAAVQDVSPDFAAMTSEERLAYHRERLNHTLGP